MSQADTQSIPANADSVNPPQPAAHQAEEQVTGVVEEPTAGAQLPARVQSPAGLSPIPEKAEVDALVRVSGALARSGFFKDARQAEQAFAKLLFGRDLGLSATAAMTGVHIVEGKPELSANVQAMMVKAGRGPRGERYDYRRVELTDEACELEFYRDGELLGSERFTQQDARRAELAGKANYQRYPRNMLFARCMSNGVAFLCPEVTGGIRVYHEGEINTAGRAPAAEPNGAGNGRGADAPSPDAPPPEAEPPKAQAPKPAAKKDREAFAAAVALGFEGRDAADALGDTIARFLGRDGLDKLDPARLKDAYQVLEAAASGTPVPPDEVIATLRAIREAGVPTDQRAQHAVDQLTSWIPF